MQVQIAIDTYDDLFSDFDIRDYRERFFSNDFLDELKMRTNRPLDAKALAIKLVIPSDERDDGAEAIILDRIREFFAMRLERNKAKKRAILFTAVKFEAIGLLIMLVANYLARFITDYLKDFLLIPSWFFVWSGLEKYMYNIRVLDKKIRFYDVLTRSSVTFEGIEAR
ncbi:MAG TPA: hypothetical protein PLQ29_14530 [Spirochaetales bacterium]|nr:hypothetical protein [Spirochaetales bacterium]HPG87910.1 hypothetical protein [Spirochaetales bacterium]HPM73985.1 hypothetical protein [Spirochaetales bacterium]